MKRKKERCNIKEINKKNNNDKIANVDHKTNFWLIFIVCKSYFGSKQIPSFSYFTVYYVYGLKTQRKFLKHMIEWLVRDARLRIEIVGR